YFCVTYCIRRHAHSFATRRSSDHPHSGYRGVPIVREIGWRPTCYCPDNDGSGKCIVLDPFSGSGTTLLVAERLGRQAVGIEINQIGRAHVCTPVTLKPRMPSYA